MVLQNKRLTLNPLTLLLFNMLILFNLYLFDNLITESGSCSSKFGKRLVEDMMHYAVVCSLNSIRRLILKTIQDRLVFHFVDSKLRIFVFLICLHHLNLILIWKRITCSICQLEELIVRKYLVLLGLVDLADFCFVVGVCFVEHHGVDEAWVCQAYFQICCECKSCWNEK